VRSREISRSRLPSSTSTREEQLELLDSLSDRRVPSAARVGWYREGASGPGIIASAIGALILLAIYRMVVRRRTTTARPVQASFGRLFLRTIIRGRPVLYAP
jgi:hypothetical protein